MSATNRGSERVNQDNYQTPNYTIDSLFENHDFPKCFSFLEPCVGEGRILQKVLSVLDCKMYFAIDISQTNLDICSHISTQKKIIFKRADFLKIKLSGQPNLIVTNPPFSLAEPFLIKCFDNIAVGGQVIFLLRLPFLESAKRKSLNNHLPLKRLLVLSKRPSFINNRNDSTAYAWFIYEKGYCGLTEVKVI